MQPLAVAVHPILGTPDYFVIAPDHTVMWHGLLAGSASWRPLGGWARAIAAYWQPDGAALRVVVVGSDGKLWLNSRAFDAYEWSGWGYPAGVGDDLHNQLVLPEP